MGLVLKGLNVIVAINIQSKESQNSSNKKDILSFGVNLENPNRAQTKTTNRVKYSRNFWVRPIFLKRCFMKTMAIRKSLRDEVKKLLHQKKYDVIKYDKIHSSEFHIPR